MRSIAKESLAFGAGIGGVTFFATDILPSATLLAMMSDAHALHDLGKTMIATQTADSFTHNNILFHSPLPFSVDSALLSLAAAGVTFALSYGISSVRERRRVAAWEKYRAAQQPQV